MPESIPFDLSRVYVSAFFCQDVIREAKTDILTAFRLTNAVLSVPTEIPASEPGSPSRSIYQQVRVSAVITIYSDEAGDFDVQIRGVGPDGKQIKPEPAEPVLHCRSGGGAAGQTITITMFIGSEKPGDFWFSVYVNDNLKTKLPLRIIHDKPVRAVQDHQPPSPSEAASE